MEEKHTTCIQAMWYVTASTRLYQVNNDSKNKLLIGHLPAVRMESKCQLHALDFFSQQQQIPRHTNACCPKCPVIKISENLTGVCLHQTLNTFKYTHDNILHTQTHKAVQTRMQASTHMVTCLPRYIWNLYTYTVYTHTNTLFSTPNISASSLPSLWQPVCQRRNASVHHSFLSYSLVVVLGSSLGCWLADSVADRNQSPDKAREWNVASLEIAINTNSHILNRYLTEMGMRSTLLSPCTCMRDRTYLHIILYC